MKALTVRKLEGQELIEFCEMNKGASESVMMEGSGYATVRNGKLALKKSEFHRAFMEAQGISLAPNKLEKPKNLPSYRVKASKRGVLPIAACYSSLIGIRPDEVAKIEVEGEGADAVIVLSREAAPMEPDDTAPISCGI